MSDPTPSPILPATNEVLGAVIPLVFVLLVAIAAVLTVRYFIGLRRAVDSLREELQAQAQPEPRTGRG